MSKGRITDKQIAQLEKSLRECLTLATAWAGYYSTSPAYARNGKTHPVHAAILKQARAALDAIEKERLK